MITPETNETAFKHCWYPEWLGDYQMCYVLEISPKNAVRVEYASGHKRWYKPETFRTKFKHHPDCFLDCLEKE